jgi:small subunit ribosomal protein S7
LKVLKRDEKAAEKAPKVMQKDSSSTFHKGTRSYSTSARRRAYTQAIINPESGALEQVESQGHIFGLPELPIPSTSHIKHRYDPVVEQVTNLLMQDGKKSKAQRVGQSVPLSFADSSTLPKAPPQVSTR